MFNQYDEDTREKQDDQINQVLAYLMQADNTQLAKTFAKMHKKLIVLQAQNELLSARNIENNTSKTVENILSLPIGTRKVSIEL